MWLPLVYPHLGTWPTAQARALPGNQTGNPLVRTLARAKRFKAILW